MNWKQQNTENNRNKWSTINNNRKKLADFCVFNNIRIMNSFYKHKDIHIFTWCAGVTKSITDCHSK
jgi:hypothetical protein